MNGPEGGVKAAEPRARLTTPVIALVGLGLALALGAGWVVGYLLTSDLSIARVVAVILGLTAAPLLFIDLELGSAFFLGILWARVSDVAIQFYNAPSIILPLGAVLILLSLFHRAARGRDLGQDRFRAFYPLLPYVLVVWGSIVWSEYTDRALEGAIELLKNLLIFWVLIDTLRRPRSLWRCVWVLVLTTGILAIPSIHQYFTGNFTSDYAGLAQSKVQNIVGEVDSYRLGGPLNDPNYFAILMGVTVPLGLGLLRTRIGAFARLLVLACMAGAALTVLLTYSRSGTIVLVVGLLLSVPHHRLRLPHLLAGLATGVLLLTITPTNVWERIGSLAAPVSSSDSEGITESSLQLRLGVQRTALEMFLTHPIGGVGIANYPPLYQDYSRWLGYRSLSREFFPHNMYLETLAETGFVGFATFALAALLPFLSLRRTRHLLKSQMPEDREAHDVHEMAAAMEIAFLAFLTSGLFEGGYPRYFWMLLALLVISEKACRSLLKAHFVKTEQAVAPIWKEQEMTRLAAPAGVTG